MTGFWGGTSVERIVLLEKKAETHRWWALGSLKNKRRVDLLVS
jgi:hypothetical protein